MTLTPAGLDLLSAKAEYASAHGISAVDVSPNELAALIALARRALELESAGGYVRDHSITTSGRYHAHPLDVLLQMARDLGWPGLQSEGGKEQGEHG